MEKFQKFEVEPFLDERYEVKCLGGGRIFKNTDDWTFFVFDESP